MARTGAGEGHPAVQKPRAARGQAPAIQRPGTGATMHDCAAGVSMHTSPNIAGTTDWCQDRVLSANVGSGKTIIAAI